MHQNPRPENKPTQPARRFAARVGAAQQEAAYISVITSVFHMVAHVLAPHVGATHSSCR
jgi:hypothetical protein